MKRISLIILLLLVSVGVLAQKQQALQVVKIATKTYTDFATAATTNTIASGYDLPAKWIVRGGFVVPTVAFNGGLLASYTVSVGVAGNLTKYAPATSVFTTALPAGIGIGGMESLTIPTSIVLTATSTGGQLNTAIQGSCNIYLVLAQLPD